MAVVKKKKTWYEVVAGNHFKGGVLGEVVATEDKNLIGRIICVNYSNLINDVKRQHIKLDFMINHVEDGRAIADVVGYEISPSHVKRVTKRSRDKVGDSFVCSTKNNVRVQIKPLILLRHKTKGSVLTVLRKKAKEILLSRIKNYDYDAIMESLLNYRLQKDTKDALSKIHPIGLVEIKIFKKLK